MSTTAGAQQTPFHLERPPLGVMPRRNWLQFRIEELAAAISRQVQPWNGPGPDAALIARWAGEIERIAYDLDSESKEL